MTSAAPSHLPADESTSDFPIFASGKIHVHRPMERNHQEGSSVHEYEEDQSYRRIGA